MKYRAAMIIYEWFWIFTIAASPCISRTHSEQRNLNVSLKVDRSEKLIWSHFEEMVKTERNEKYKKHSVLTSARVPQLQQQWAGGEEQAWTPSWQFGIWKNWKLKIEGEQAWTPSCVWHCQLSPVMIMTMLTTIKLTLTMMMMMPVYLEKLEWTTWDEKAFYRKPYL